MAILSPSLLAADLMNLQRDVETVRASGSRWVHIDVMDGLFVPNLSFGYTTVKGIRGVSGLVLDVHLMIEKPLRYVQQFCDAGADYLTVHVEADTPENIRRTLEEIRRRGVKASLTIKPGTPAEAVEPYLPLCDLVLVMTVEPGFGGQKFMADMMGKVRYLRERVDALGLDCHVEVDGGVDLRTAPVCKQSGADVLVAGSAFFKAEDKAAFCRQIEAE